MGKPRATQRKRLGKKPKGTNKNAQPLKWTLKRVETRDQAKAEELRAKINVKTPARSCKRAARIEPDPEPVTKVARTKEDEADQRVTIRYFFRRMESPPD